ncbi:regulator of G-protein signaling domain-containing protein [Planctomycetota bacterium]
MEKRRICVTLAVAFGAALTFGVLSPEAVQAGSPHSKPKTVEHLILHSLWKCRQGYSEGNFYFVTPKPRKGETYPLPVLLISSKLKKSISDKYVILAGKPAVKKGYCDGTFTYSKKKGWTFKVSFPGAHYAGMKKKAADTFRADIAMFLTRHRSFQVVMEDPIQRKNFRKDLTHALTVENLDFLDAAEAFKKKPKSKAWGKLFANFIPESAKQQVNIAFDLRKKLEGLNGEINKGSLKVKDKKVLDALQEAIDEVWRMLLRDPFTRYHKCTKPVCKGVYEKALARISVEGMPDK